jgi:hypothetical protein
MTWLSTSAFEAKVVKTLPTETPARSAIARMVVSS